MWLKTHGCFWNGSLYPSRHTWGAGVCLHLEDYTAEQKRYVGRQEMIKLCLEKASEIVDAVNAVPHCRVYKVMKAEPLYEGMGVIRLDVTFEPRFPQDE